MNQQQIPVLLFLVDNADLDDENIQDPLLYTILMNNGQISMNLDVGTADAQ